MVSMKKNIAAADFVVVAATKRYFTEDVHKGLKSNGLSEMIHTEVGMAYISSKPIVVFVEEGVNVGNFIPNITQYIVLDGTQENLNSQLNLIISLLYNAVQQVQAERQKKAMRSLGNIIIGSLAVYGGAKLLSGNGSSEYEEDDDEYDDE